MVGVLPVLALLFLSWTLLSFLWWRWNHGERRVLVVVLGDAGRSPRMQYHCLSLLEAGYSVDLVAYGGSQLIYELRGSEHVHHHELIKCPVFSGLPLFVAYVMKVGLQTCNLLWVIFWKTAKPSHVIVQTPPSIPTLMVCVLTSYLRSSKLIFDYHNYGHTLLALSLGNSHPLVRISKMYEDFLSSFAHSNLCVSNAMKRDLERRLHISATVFYDRPPKRFKPADVDIKHKLFMKLGTSTEMFRGVFADHNEKVTAFTEVVDGKVRMRKDRPFLLISSTSWTKDEDFGVLLEALQGYDEVASEMTKNLPKLLCVITGKGPLKEYYMRIIGSLKFSWVTICTLWLSAEDYPLLLERFLHFYLAFGKMYRWGNSDGFSSPHGASLIVKVTVPWGVLLAKVRGSADLGVCLHKSSSGLDLPMKVVDMFGCGLPVCALHFSCLDELVIHDSNGTVFSTSSELTTQIQDLCCGFPGNTCKLNQYRENLSSFQKLRWDHYWTIHVLPLIKQ